jgi:hypothetical protein
VRKRQRYPHSTCYWWNPRQATTSPTHPLPLTPSIAKPNLWGGLKGDSKLALLFISRRSQRPRFAAAVAGRRHLREGSDSAACVAHGQAKLFGLKGCLAALRPGPPCYVPCYILVLFVRNVRNNPSLLFYIHAPIGTTLSQWKVAERSGALWCTPGPSGSHSLLLPDR